MHNADRVVPVFFEFKIHLASTVARCWLDQIRRAYEPCRRRVLGERANNLTNIGNDQSEDKEMGVSLSVVMKSVQFGKPL
jgi:hypothetical protein